MGKTGQGADGLGMPLETSESAGQNGLTDGAQLVPDAGKEGARLIFLCNID